MTSDASFHETLKSLLERSDKACEHARALEGQAFADERGWLSPAEQRDLETQQARADALEREVAEYVDNLREDHTSAWNAYLEAGRRIFRAVERGDVDRDGGVPTNAERQLAHILFQAWGELATKNAPGRGLCWTLSAGDELVARWAVAGPVN